MRKSIADLENNFLVLKTETEGNGQHDLKLRLTAGIADSV